MRITTTDNRASGGLAILPDLPDLPAVLIEGRNGIGKTILVRLLELISGVQPFAEQTNNWRSLQARLGETVVSVSGLKDDRELVVRFTPDKWPIDDAPLVVGGWLGEVVLDGEPASVEDAQQLLWVERFAGNENLDRTLRRRIDIYADRVERTHRRVGATITCVNELLAPLIEQLRPLDPERLISQQDELAHAEEHEIEARAALEDAIGHHRRVLTAVDNARRVVAAEDPEAEVMARRAALQEQLAQASEERDAVQVRVENTAERLKREGDAQGALADAQRIQRYRTKRLRNLASTASVEARQVSVEPELESCRELQREARDQLHELRAQRALLDASGQTARLIDRFDGLFVSADAEGLDDQELAVLRDERFSVNEVHAGMRARADELRGMPLPDEIMALDAAIGDAQMRAARLSTLVRRLEDLARQVELVEEAGEEVGAATERAQNAGSLDEAFREDSRRLGQLEEQIDRLGVDLAAVYEQMGLVGGQSLEDARKDLAAELGALGLAEATDLAAEEEDARRRAEEATHALKLAGERASGLRRAVTVVQAAIDGVVSSLSTDPNWEWVAPVPVAGTTDGLARFAAGRARLLRLERRLDGADRLLESFRTVASAALSGDDPLMGNTPRVRAVRAVLGNELRGFLDTPAIRAALFDGAAVVDVNPVEAHLTLETSEGRSTRPFESFSTGEQAFAFTQARIRELEVPDKPNRLLVLDEFGAFVAADRLPALIKFLMADALGAICDQVLVILPLQVDYEADAEFTTGALADRYNDRAAQITERGYCAAPLNA